MSRCMRIDLNCLEIVVFVGTNEPCLIFSTLILQQALMFFYGIDSIDLRNHSFQKGPWVDVTVEM